MSLPGSLHHPPQCHRHLGKPLEPYVFTSIASESKPQREQTCPSDLWLLPDGKNVIQICLSLCFLPNVLTSCFSSQIFRSFTNTHSLVPKDLHTPALTFQGCSCFQKKKKAKAKMSLSGQALHTRQFSVVQIINLFLQRQDQAFTNSLSSPPILTTLRIFLSELVLHYLAAQVKFLFFHSKN